MHVLFINGSSRQKGNTAYALRVMEEQFTQVGMTTELVHIGKQPVAGCLACGGCSKVQGACVQKNDLVNEVIQKMIAADGIVIGTPVYYAGLNGALKSLLDRAFYVCGAAGGLLRHKVGAAVAVARRDGGLPAVDEVLKFYQISEMVLPSGDYWSSIYGAAPEECQHDAEGMHVVQTLALNMIWLMQLIEHGKQDFPAPSGRTKPRTNFIR